jgi:hypothetical protein
MNRDFASLIESLEPSFQSLVTMPPLRFTQLPSNVPTRGIYLFSEGNRHLYVGRTNGIKKRLQNHCRPSGTHFTATFAFRIAREDTGQLKASYKAAGSRSELCANAVFGPAFSTAKARVGAMDIRYVEESDAVRKALLEIYVATVLKTPYNDFDNH